MLEKLAHIKGKLQKDSAPKQSATAQERLFKHWHRILLGYAICNVIFIILSLLIVSGITSGVSDNDELGSFNAPGVFNRNSLVESIQLQRYKSLVEQEVVNFPDSVNIR